MCACEHFSWPEMNIQGSIKVKVNLEHLWHNVEIDSSLIFLKKNHGYEQP